MQKRISEDHPTHYQTLSSSQTAMNCCRNSRTPQKWRVTKEHQEISPWSLDTIHHRNPLDFNVKSDALSKEGSRMSHPMHPMQRGKNHYPHYPTGSRPTDSKFSTLTNDTVASDPRRQTRWRLLVDFVKRSRMRSFGFVINLMEVLFNALFYSSQCYTWAPQQMLWFE